MLTKRNSSAIRQYAKTHQMECRMEQALNTLETILPKLGKQSNSRAMINRIGITLLQKTVTIVAPSCPDYSHDQGKYDFRSVGSGVPLLSQLHITFLNTIIPDIPYAQCEIVVADQEADDIALCKKIGQTKDGFLDMIHKSILTTKTHLSDKSWAVTAMTKRFPDLRNLETTVVAEIENDPRLQSRLDSDTRARSEMYRKIGVYNFDEMRKRTIRTASQYGALAIITAREKLLVCNHETVNLGWYTRYNAAVLHNPVSVY